MKKFMLMVATGLTLVACNTEKKDASATTEDLTTTPVIEAEAPIITEPVVYTYQSTDGKQHFETTFTDDIRETMTLKDVEGNVVYEMKMVVSADGAKWENAEGVYFWTKGDTFYFGKGDEQICEGNLVVTSAETTPEVAPITE